MCAKMQYKSFMLTGCVTYTATIAVVVLSVIDIVKGIMNNIGAWPIIGMILFTIAASIIGTGLGILFQSYGMFLKRLSTCRCDNRDCNKG